MCVCACGVPTDVTTVVHIYMYMYMHTGWLVHYLHIYMALLWMHQHCHQALDEPVYMYVESLFPALSSSGLGRFYYVTCGTLDIKTSWCKRRKGLETNFNKDRYVYL